jgi:hypothetical protein
MNKNSKKKRKKNFIKFISGRGSKNLRLTVFLAEKTEPNYETAYNNIIYDFKLKVSHIDKQEKYNFIYSMFHHIT